jgi:stage V sporulation protein B
MKQGADSATTARQAGRGGVALSAAKLYFLALGLIQQVLLTWLLKDGYGALRGALSPASITYNPLITAGVQGMSRAISRVDEGDRPAVIRLGLLVHLGVSILIGGGFLLLAPVLGSVLNSDYLVPSFRMLALIVFMYGMYAPLVGVLNGMRRFAAQAGLDVLSATLRTAGLFGGAWLLLPRGSIAAVEGASLGAGLAAAFMFLAALVLVGLGRRGRSPVSVGEHLGFIVPVIVAQVFLNLLSQADTNTLRGFATRAAETAGLEPQAADLLVGSYSAGQLFALLPYQLLMGITFILFPMLASAHARGQSDAVARFTHQGTRIALIVIGLVVSISSGLSESLLRLVFPAQFAEHGTAAMQILTLGLGAFALFGVFTTVLNSLGRQWAAFALTVVALLAVVGLNWLMVRGARFGDDLLVYTALSTSLGIGAATLVAGAMVLRVARAAVAPLVLVRVGLVTALLIVGLRQLPALGPISTIAASAVIGVVYIVLLVATRELGRHDLAMLLTVLGKSKT